MSAIGRRTIDCPRWCGRDHGELELRCGDVVHERIMRCGSQEDAVDVLMTQQTLREGAAVKDPVGVDVHLAGNMAFELSSNSAREIGIALIEAATIADEANEE